MKKKSAILLIAFVHPALIFSQVRPADPDTSVFSQWVNILKAKKEFNYVGIGPWRVNGRKETPLLLESQLRQDFLLYRGRSNQAPFLRSLMINFDMGLNFRVYQGPDNPSYPIRPLNFMPGITVHYFMNQAGFSARKMAMLDKSRISDFYSLKMTLSHFSNGQSGAFYNADSTNTNRENGNFSTNFLRTEFSWSKFINDKLLSSAISFQQDFGIGGLLAFGEGQLKSYGKSRLGLSLLFHSGNLQVGNYNYKRITYRHIDSTGSRKKLLRLKSSRKFKRYVSFRVRYDMDYILDDVSNYLTFKSRSASKTRISSKFLVAVYPANSRTLGFFFLLYSGRDYYNVCYTDRIMNVKSGLLFELNKYVPPGTQYMRTQ